MTNGRKVKRGWCRKESEGKDERRHGKVGKGTGKISSKEKQKDKRKNGMTEGRKQGTAEDGASRATVPPRAPLSTHGRTGR